MKRIFIIFIVFLFLLTACEANYEDTHQVSRVTSVDCAHRVVCYERGVAVSAFSCVYIPGDIKECS